MISKLDLYPNPTSGPVTVEYTLVQNENITIDLVDHMGRKVKSLLTSTSKAAGLHKDDFMLDGEITPGLYYIQITSDHGVQNLKLMVVKV